MHCISRLFDYLIEKYRRSLASAHSKNHSIADVFKVLCPGCIHELKDFEQLLKMEDLFGTDDVDHLVEIVFLVSMERCANVSR